MPVLSPTELVWAGASGAVSALAVSTASRHLEKEDKLSNLQRRKLQTPYYNGVSLELRIGNLVLKLPIMPKQAGGVPR